MPVLPLIFTSQDVVFDDANWIGPSRVGYRKLPVPELYSVHSVGGANYEDVDEIPPSFGDFYCTNAVDQTDSFTFDALQLGLPNYP